MRLTRRAVRPAFSLLEMVLALAVSMVLLLALYLFMSANVYYTQSGRDVLAEGTIARNIAAKISADLNSQVGPLDPRLADYSGGPTTTSGSTTPATTPSTTTTTPVMTPSLVTPSTVVNATTQLPIVAYNVGIYGQPTFLVLSNYRVQKPNPNAQTNVPDLEPNSDLRRTYYWLVSNGSNATGLARMEIKAATSTDADTLDPTTFPEQNKYIFAPEVKNVLFEYYDGLTWQPTWDGSLQVESGNPPSGPPLAIRITITLKSTLGQPVPAGADVPDGPIYLQIVAVPTTNSFTPKLANSQ
jgi:hypothetical protein